MRKIPRGESVNIVFKMVGRSVVANYSTFLSNVYFRIIKIMFPLMFGTKQSYSRFSLVFKGLLKSV